jgi:hypothetical protein
LKEQTEKTIPRIVKEIIVGVLAGVIIEATVGYFNIEGLFPILPYIWFAILVFSTITGLKGSKKVQDKFVEIYGRLHKRQRMISYIIVGMIGFGVAVGYWIGIKKVFELRAKAGASPEEGFRVSFKTQFVDMRHNLDGSALWVLYKSGFGDTISPVALLEFLEITNLYAHPISISSYSLSIKTAACGWVYLTPIRPRGVNLLWGASGLNAAEIIKLENHELSQVWANPLPAYGTEFGMLLFDTKVECPVQEGSVIQLKLDLTDSLGKSFSYTSPSMNIQKNFTVGNSIGQANVASFEGIGLAADVRLAHRKIYSDPIPDVIKSEEKGTASIFNNGKVGIIVLEDGAFGPCSSCVITPRPGPSR